MVNASMRFLALFAGCIFCSAVITGCESSSTDTAINVYLQNTENSTATVIAGQRQTVYFVATARETGTGTNTLYFPLHWSVDHPDLGTIKASAGNTAAYESTGLRGNNVITVKDQAGREGIAVVEAISASTPES